MKKVRLAIVDDHKIFLDGITSLLQTVDNIDLAFVAESGQDGLRMLNVHSDIDVLISDISMDKMDGIELCELVKKKYPGINILILSMHDDVELAYELLQKGVSGYVLKNTGKEELIQAIESVQEGIPFYNDDIKKEIFKKIAFPSRKKKSAPSVLTKREIEIIKLIAAEYTTQEIADKLCISLYTVETHRKNILRKTNVRNLAGLIKYAIKANIIE